MTMVNDEALLAQLEELNRSLQNDSKNVHSLKGVLPRKESLCSDLNLTLSNDDDKLSLSSINGVNSSSEISSRMMEKWSNIVNNWQQSSRRRSQVRDLIKQSCGVPHHFRPLVWQLLCGSSDEHSLMNQLKLLYPEYLKQQSPCENAIRRDITRTYPQHDLFKSPNGDGQERLFNIMKAYSIHDREVGYCQGSGFIGGLLLIQMPEEDAFAVLVSLLFEHQLRNLYKPNMSEVGLCMHQLDCLVEDHLPKLALHFRSHNFHATVYASGWFLTLFTLPFSIDLASRVMDLFIVEGFEVIFRISLAYLTIYQDELLKMEMELMLRFLQSIGPQQLEEDSNKLFDIAFQIKLNTRKMKKAEKEYLTLRIEEEAHQIELRRLRTENGLLLQRIDRLEKEVEQLSQHLVTRNMLINDNTQENNRVTHELIESNRKIDCLRRNLSETETQLQLVVGQLNGKISEEYTKDIIRERRSDVSYGVVHQLQTQLVNVRLKEAESNSTLRELKEKCRRLEEENCRLSKSLIDEVAQLQEDLVAIKLKEGETGLSLKDNQKKLAELNRLWLAHIAKCSMTNNNKLETSKDRSLIKDNSELVNEDPGVVELTRRLIETEYASDLNNARQKIMEMEAQKHINSRQISRRDEEIIFLKERLEVNQCSQRSLKKELNDADRRFVDLETKRKEDIMMWKIQNMEADSIIAELKQKLAQFEIVREEIIFSKSDSKINNKLSSVKSIPAPLYTKWKDLPHTIMTDSIGPLDDICFNPDDPMITSIYIHRDECSTTNHSTDLKGDVARQSYHSPCNGGYSQLNEHIDHYDSDIDNNTLM